ncbi:MAG: threonylcarbamoyl-AMP synthase [Candidatus Aenigmarchaeota archaeon]|nr:threonylcarbamoyl-AMP synthase [Candidatus Aenigmarchaeota archaeon]
MKILKTGTALTEAVEVLKNGGVIIYPTDTVYGMGADATSANAVKKIYRIKGRKSRKPLSICVSDLKMAKEYVKFDKVSLRMARKFLPGPLTLVLPQKRRIKFVSKDGKIAIRIPENKFALRLAKKFGRPIISTSANMSGKKPPVKISEIEGKVRRKCDLVIDGGACRFKKPSTIVDFKLRKIIREGAVKSSELRLK